MIEINEDAVELIAEDLYRAALERPPRNAWAPSWDYAEPETRDEYREYARVAIRGHYAAYQTPHEDEEHQGGNLLERFFEIHAENLRLHAGKSCDIRRHRGELVERLTRERDELKVELGRRQRQGQTAMNVLALLRPDMANEIQGTDLDPFDKDENLAGFFAWLIERTRDNLLVGKLEKRVAEDDGVRHKLDDVLAEMHEDEG